MIFTLDMKVGEKKCLKRKRWNHIFWFFLMATTLHINDISEEELFQHVTGFQHPLSGVDAPAG